jgi:hypothetical protein
LIGDCYGAGQDIASGNWQSPNFVVPGWGLESAWVQLGQVESPRLQTKLQTNGAFLTVLEQDPT